MSFFRITLATTTPPPQLSHESKLKIFQVNNSKLYNIVIINNKLVNTCLHVLKINNKY